LLFDIVYVSSKYMSGFLMAHAKVFVLLLLRIVQLDFYNHLQVFQLIEKLLLDIFFSVFSVVM